jgi:hypothetical protein
MSSAVQHPQDPVLRLYPPAEALRRARPLPSREELVIEGVSDEEWEAFHQALADT